MKMSKWIVKNVASNWTQRPSCYLTWKKSMVKMMLKRWSVHFVRKNSEGEQKQLTMKPLYTREKFKMSSNAICVLNPTRLSLTSHAISETNTRIKTADFLSKSDFSELWTFTVAWWGVRKWWRLWWPCPEHCCVLLVLDGWSLMFVFFLLCTCFGRLICWYWCLLFCCVLPNIIFSFSAACCLSRIYGHWWLFICCVLPLDIFCCLLPSLNQHLQVQIKLLTSPAPIFSLTLLCLSLLLWQQQGASASLLSSGLKHTGPLNFCSRNTDASPEAGGSSGRTSWWGRWFYEAAGTFQCR